MNTLQTFWSDESGSVVTAELVTVGTLVTVGAVVGLQEVSNTLNEELRDVSQAIRNLDQSYSYRGFAGCNSMTAGSSFRDPNSKTVPATPPAKPANPPSAPKTSDAGTAQPEMDATFFADADEFPAEDDGPVTPADEKLSPAGG